MELSVGLGDREGIGTGILWAEAEGNGTGEERSCCCGSISLAAWFRLDGGGRSMEEVVTAGRTERECGGGGGGGGEGRESIGGKSLGCTWSSG